MHAWLLVAAVAIGSVDAPDGTLVVLENSNYVVERVTHSEVTHIGIVIKRGVEPWIYEATPSVVRRLPLDRFLQEIASQNRGKDDEKQIRVRLYAPVRQYTPLELKKMTVFLESQVGRRYSLRGYVRHKPGDGIHCAELVSSALARTGRFQFDEAYAVSPVRLVDFVKPSHDRPIAAILPNAEVKGTWCERSSQWWIGCFSWCAWASSDAWSIIR